MPINEVLPNQKSVIELKLSLTFARLFVYSNNHEIIFILI